MKIAVVGLWHLGSVISACLAAADHEVLGYDANVAVITALKTAAAPLFEPGLDFLIASGLKSGKLHYHADPSVLNQAEIVWVTYDTPVDDNDIADVNFVMHEIEKILPHLAPQTLVIISSQLPVGSTRYLLQKCKQLFPEKQITFAYSPENLRLGKAIAVFTKPDRIVVGLESLSDQERVQKIFHPFTAHIVWMSIESAEMTKHALNAFLATSVVFINELATLCEQVGANAREVERGLKTEERIGLKAYLKPGNAIAGGTLLRDVNFLVQMGKQTPLLSAVLTSNQAHKQWSCKRLLEVFSNLQNKVVVTLGLTYKAGTDTLRRSTAVELCKWLNTQGAKVVAFDPVVNQLPAYLSDKIALKSTLEEALVGADAVVVATEWPQFSALTSDQFTTLVGYDSHLFDANGFLMKSLGQDSRIQYHSVGSIA